MLRVSARIVMYTFGWCPRYSSPGRFGPKTTAFGILLAYVPIALRVVVQRFAEIQLVEDGDPRTGAEFPHMLFKHPLDFRKIGSLRHTEIKHEHDTVLITPEHVAGHGNVSDERVGGAIPSDVPSSSSPMYPAPNRAIRLIGFRAG